MSRDDDLRTLRAAKRLLKVRQAKDDLIDFAELIMSHPEDPENPDRSKYSAQYYHRAIAAALQEVEKGAIPRLILTVPPRHGKSQLTTRLFPAWYVGRDPYRSVIVGSYNQTFAEDFGRDVRAILQQPAYKQIFPSTSLRKGSEAADRLQTDQGGALFFVGRGGSVTGRGADLVIIDDPLKNSVEADSVATREELWNWFNSDIMSRFMTDTGQCVVIQTRWHEDDLIGRLTDPSNPLYSEDEAKQWKIINIPALAEEDDVLGRAVGEPLWPERFGTEYLLGFKRRNPRGFNALYQQRPTPDDGDFFKAHDIRTYRAGEAPPLSTLRIYAASDHAVSTKQENDRTCLLIVGVDPNDVIWVLDCWWKRAKTDETVEQMVKLMKRWEPLRWWADQDHIGKSIGPFLKKRMQELEVYVSVSETKGYADKQVKAQAIQARMSMGMVMFPAGAAWFENAKQELLKFPRARHDDFVDTLATIGRGLGKMMTGKAPVQEDKGPAVGTWGWVKAQAKIERDERTRVINMAGW